MTIRTLHCIAGRVGYCICDVCKYVEKGSGSRKVADDPTLLFGGVGLENDDRKPARSPKYTGYLLCEQDKNALQMHNTLRCRLC